jgi:anthranilate synthase/aminodeoxychorismate synthase-like glutamine amidotransferase
LPNHVILLIDNYDSFVYNLSRYVKELGEAPRVVRHDATSVDEIADLNPSHIIISPGPCSPNEAGISTDVVRALGDRIPILGVCLGHQCIGQAYGGQIVRARAPMHGKTSRIHHSGGGIFSHLPNPFVATRYHSLVIAPESLPDCLTVTARTDDGQIMAVQHLTHPVYGVQFHPESVLTEHGYRLIDHFLHGVTAIPRAVPQAADGALLAYAPQDSTLASAPPSADLVR